MDNRLIAQRLLDYAGFLDSRETNPYRARAYRIAAETVMRLERPVADIVQQEGRNGLEALPGIGEHLSFTLEVLVRTGEFHTLHFGDCFTDFEENLLGVPGVGPRLAQKIREKLDITKLKELEKAAHDGRLAQLGVGPKRLRGIIDYLASRPGRNPPPGPLAGEPLVDEILAVDLEYRHLAEQGNLPTQAPRSFNPFHQPWQPVLQTDRNGWHYRALYSNSALAHRLQRTHDWVVIHFTDGLLTGQRTVVTETQGDLQALRVVRGREGECRQHYRPSSC
jgi:putative hydrolase